MTILNGFLIRAALVPARTAAARHAIISIRPKVYLIEIRLIKVTFLAIGLHVIRMLTVIHA
jgi:hypothetical protein